MKKNRTCIGISWIHSYLYCPYQLYLDRVKKVEVEPTAEMVAGAQRHLELKIIHEEVAEEIMSVEEAMEKAPVENVTYVFREVDIRGVLPFAVLLGYIDELHIAPDRILILDDKPGNFPYISSKYQVWGYALAFKLRYNPQTPIYGVLRNRDTLTVMWTEKFTDAREKEITELLREISDVLEGRTPARKTKNKNKCRSCRYRKVCEELGEVV